MVVFKRINGEWVKDLATEVEAIALDEIDMLFDVEGYHADDIKLTVGGIEKDWKAYEILNLLEKLNEMDKFIEGVDY